MLLDCSRAQRRMSVGLASPTRVQRDAGFELETRTRRPHRGLRLWLDHREHPPRRSSRDALALLSEAPAATRRSRGAVLRRTPTENHEATRLRAVRDCLADDASGS